MDKFPEIATNRLVLNRLASDDIPNIIEYAGNIKVSETTLNIPHPYAQKDAIFWINSANVGFENKTQFTFGIRTITPDKFIGGIGLKVNNRFNRAEMGYWIAEPYWGLGYATEAVEAVLQFGFDQLNLHKIYATYLSENPSSGKVMIKNGMIKEAELKDHTKKGEFYKSLIQYRLTQTEFRNLKN